MNILYGVPGEGMGHATRSKVIIDHLLKKGHAVKVVSSSRAFAFFDKHFPGKVIEIKGFHFAFKNEEVSKSATLLLNLKNAPQNLLHNLHKKIVLENEFKPDLVISDFESFSYLFAKFHKLPVISIDNMQVINRCKTGIVINKADKGNYDLARHIVKAKVPGCDQYFISTFFEADVIKKDTVLVPPVIRQEIQDTKTSSGNHIIMYQTSGTLQTVKQVLQQLPNEIFYVYGLNQNYTDGNIVYKPFSEQEFIKDFAGSKAVIANGGFSFLSEAVYLKKPVYSFPIKKQYEQYMNAAYIEKLNYGRHFNILDADSLKAFLYDLNSFEMALQFYKQDGNKVLFTMLDAYLMR